MGADRQNVVLESFAPVEILAAAHVDFRIEQRGRGCDADCRVGDEPRVTARNRRFGQIFQIRVLFEFERLRQPRIVVAHLGQLGRRTGRNMGVGAFADDKTLFIAIAVHVGTSGREDVDARHLRHAFVEIEFLLDDQRGMAFQIAHDRPAVVVEFESQKKIPHLARSADGHRLRLFEVGTHLFGCCEIHRTAPVRDSETFSLLLPRSKSAIRRIRATSSSIPSPVMQLVNTNGLPGRISSESRRITSRSART